MAAQSAQTSQPSARVRAFDAVRGFSVISMVLFHLCYDLRFIYRLPLGWFAPPLQDIWRASISWAFVTIAGCMFAYSRNNLRRAGKYLAVAFLIFVATTVVAVDTPINFGVIYCMGACTLACWLLDRVGLRPQSWESTLLFFALFLFLLPLAHGRVGIGPLALQVPRAFYATPFLSWLGLPGPGFASGDYYPLLPYLGLYLAGSTLGRRLKTKGAPDWLLAISCQPLEAVGRYALPIYVIHQPLILGMLTLILG